MQIVFRRKTRRGSGPVEADVDIAAKGQGETRGCFLAGGRAEKFLSRYWPVKIHKSRTGDRVVSERRDF